jgi:hypothetical protein
VQAEEMFAFEGGLLHAVLSCWSGQVTADISAHSSCYVTVTGVAKLLWTSGLIPAEVQPCCYGAVTGVAKLLQTSVLIPAATLQ